MHEYCSGQSHRDYSTNKNLLGRRHRKKIEGTSNRVKKHRECPSVSSCPRPFVHPSLRPPEMRFEDDLFFRDSSFLSQNLPCQRLELSSTLSSSLFFVADGINSVGDYNSSQGGCRLSVCLCVCLSVSTMNYLLKFYSNCFEILSADFLWPN